MTAAAPVRTQRPLFEPRRRSAGSSALASRAPRGPDGDGLTLEQQLDRVWEGLLAVGVAECPVCGGRLERGGEDGRCSGCQSTLD